MKNSNISRGRITQKRRITKRGKSNRGKSKRGKSKRGKSKRGKSKRGKSRRITKGRKLNLSKTASNKTKKYNRNMKGGAVPLPHLMNLPRSPYFPSLNRVSVFIGKQRGYEMLDEESNTRLKHCLNDSKERIKIFTKSISETGYLYTPDTIQSSNPYFDKTEQFRELYDDMPVEEVPDLERYFREKYPEYNLTDRFYFNFSQAAQSTYVALKSPGNTGYILLIKSDGHLINRKEIFASMVGFILGISPELLDFGKIIHKTIQYKYLLFKKYNSFPGRFRGRGDDIPGNRHGAHDDDEDGKKNFVRDDTENKWYYIDMEHFEWYNELYMIYE